MNKALFLDRDGVINFDKKYVYKQEEFEFIEGVFEACRYFQNLGYLIIIVTNQSGIARGYYTEKDYKILTAWMLERFVEEEIKITKVYYCPHHVGYTHECDCRKPQPGMILKAQEEFEIDLTQSKLVGDKVSDIKAGLLAGVRENYLVAVESPSLENISCQTIQRLLDLKHIDANKRV